MSKHNVDVIIKARDKASKKFNKVGKSANRMSKTLENAAQAAVAYLSVRAITNFVSSSIEAFGRQEAAVKNLRTALGLLGQSYQIRGMATFATQMQKITVHGDEAVMEVMKLGASIGKLSGGKLKEATKAAIGLSSAFGMDLTSAMRLVARAAVGDTSTLARYGIKLDTTKTKAEQFYEVLKIGAGNFKLATEEAKTHLGQIDQMKNAYSDLKESIGETAVETVGGPGFIKRWLEGTNESIKTYGDYIRTIRNMTFKERLRQYRDPKFALGVFANSHRRKEEAEGLDIVNPKIDDNAAKLKAAKEQAEGVKTAYEKLKDKAKQLFEQTRTPLEKFKNDWAEITNLWKTGLISLETYLRALAKLKNKLPKPKTIPTGSAGAPGFGAMSGMAPIMGAVMMATQESIKILKNKQSGFGGPLPDLAAREARFLTTAQGARSGPEIKTANNTEKIVSKLDLIEKNTRRAKPGLSPQEQTPAGMSEANF
jgi:hypothetical protein